MSNNIAECEEFAYGTFEYDLCENEKLCGICHDNDHKMLIKHECCNVWSHEACITAWFGQVKEKKCYYCKREISQKFCNENSDFLTILKAKKLIPEEIQELTDTMLKIMIKLNLNVFLLHPSPSYELVQFFIKCNNSNVKFITKKIWDSLEDEQLSAIMSSGNEMVPYINARTLKIAYGMEGYKIFIYPFNADYLKIDESAVSEIEKIIVGLPLNEIEEIFNYVFTNSVDYTHYLIVKSIILTDVIFKTLFNYAWNNKCIKQFNYLIELMYRTTYPAINILKLFIELYNEKKAPVTIVKLCMQSINDILYYVDNAQIVDFDSIESVITKIWLEDKEEQIYNKILSINKFVGDKGSLINFLNPKNNISQIISYQQNYRNWNQQIYSDLAIRGNRSSIVSNRVIGWRGYIAQ